MTTSWLNQLPLKGSKEYRVLVTALGFAIGLVWIAKDEYQNPKITATPKALRMNASEVDDWNKQFGPVDPTKWAIPEAENRDIISKLEGAEKPRTDDETSRRMW